MLVYNMQGLQKNFGSKIQKKNSLFRGLIVALGKGPLCRGSILALSKGAFAESQGGLRSAKVAGLGLALGM